MGRQLARGRRSNAGSHAYEGASPVSPRRWAARAADSAKVIPIAVIAVAVACIPLSLFVYWPRLNDFFVYDDFFFLRAVRNHGFWEVARRAFTFPQPKPFDEVTLFWRPSIDFYFYAAKPLGLHAQPYHLVNFALHGVVGGLAVVFVWRLTHSAVAGAAAGLLFTVAPTYDFAVTWIAQVSEIAGAALILAALISYHAYLTDEQRRRSYAAATVFFTLLAFLTKESTAILVVLLPALALAVPPSERKRTMREVVMTLAPPVLLGIVFAAAMQLHELTQPGHLQTFGLHMARNFWRYLEWMVFPYQFGAHLAAREASAAVFLAIGVATVVARQRALAFLFVWTVVALAPYLGFDEWIELRYTYLAALPFIAFVVCALVTAVGHLPRPALVPAAAALTAAVMLTLVVTPFRTRDQQAWFAGEAAQYERMVDSVRNLCGEMPRDSYVYLLDAPYRDLWGIHTPAVLNLYYHHLNAASVPELHPLAVFIEHKCGLQYDADTHRYARVG